MSRYYINSLNTITDPELIQVLDRIDSIISKLHVRLGTRFTVIDCDRVERLERKKDSLMKDPKHQPCVSCGLHHVEEEVVHKAQLGYNGMERKEFICDECNEEYI